jgi:indole-3-glycerol phosphate synthase
MVTYLDKILAAHRDQAHSDRRSLDHVVDEARAQPATRSFRQALLDTTGLAVISEIKRRSPSKGDLNPGVDPATWASAYADGGATCLSVLTDPEFFGGSADDLAQARDAVSVPVLRKDFTVSALDVCDARIMGADAILLIVAALDDLELADFHDLAVELGLDVLLETHDEAEIDRALSIGASMIGVNQRDLVTFEVDQQRAVRLAGVLPADVVRVAESGVRGAADARVLYSAGYQAVLVGEALMTSGNPTQAVQELRAVR